MRRMMELLVAGYAAVGLALAIPSFIASPAAAAARNRPPTVLAAASLQESLTKAADAWTARGHARPVISFAASSALARQIEAGAPADLFISADEGWMDQIARKGLVKAGTRSSFLGNSLVLIAPASARRTVTIRAGFPLARLLGPGRLSIADPDSVPAGKYAKAALVSLGVWRGVEDKLARGENVRAALAFVERGETPFGIVYKTDARASTKVWVAGTFPTSSYPRISYPIARLNSATSRDSEGFRRFLISPAGLHIFRAYGFKTN
ncbi:MAG: molybdate ABC transporter substrate-binding protein [Sphingomicrobium sp.]